MRPPPATAAGRALPTPSSDGTQTGAIALVAESHEKTTGGRPADMASREPTVTAAPNLRRLLGRDGATRLLPRIAAVARSVLWLRDSDGDLIAAATASEDGVGGAPGRRERGPADWTGSRLATGSLAQAPIEHSGMVIGSVGSRPVEEGASAAAIAASVAALVADIATERGAGRLRLENMSEDLLGKYEEVTLLYDLGQALFSVFDVETLCEIALERTLLVIDAARGFVALADEAGGSLDIVASAGREERRRGAVRRARHVSGLVTASGRQLLLDEGEPSPEYEGEERRAGEAILSVPVAAFEGGASAEAAPLGALTLAGAPEGGRFTAGHARLAGTIAAQLAAAIQTSRLVTRVREAEGLRREIEIASSIQQGLLPSRAPDVKGLAVAGLCVPATNVGGDYYDFMVHPSGETYVLVADVSGHSISSALMMAMARSALRREMASGASPAAILAAINSTMFADLAAAGHFITIFCARYQPLTQRLDYANGGHNPPALRRAADGATSELEADGAAIGIFEDYAFEQRSLRLEEGDLVVLFTDGVVEALSPAGEPFGDPRLFELVSQSAASPNELNERAYAAVREHARGAAQQDDVTLVTMQRTQAP